MNAEPNRIFDEKPRPLVIPLHLQDSVSDIRRVDKRKNIPRGEIKIADVSFPMHESVYRVLKEIADVNRMSIAEVVRAFIYHAYEYGKL